MTLHREIVNPVQAMDPNIDPNVMKHNKSGSYTLVIHLDRDAQLTIGRFGVVRFSSAFYTYTGSALGPGGLRARIRRHLRHEETKRAHWHVDRLLNLGSIMEVWWQAGIKRQECIWAATLATVGALHIQGFGASDCRCPGHLIRYNTPSAVAVGYQRIQNHLDCDH